MLSYLKKFNDLPPELRQEISGKEAMAAIDKLEKKYSLPLAVLIMKVMVREVAINDLTSYLRRENLNEAAANDLARELKDKIFFSLRDYLATPETLARPRTGQSGKTVDMSLSEAASQTRTDSEPLVKGASFFFSADDETEIRELAKKAVAEKTQLTAEAIEEKLKTILDRAQINFGSVDLANRFKQILKIYLRGIRNKIETKLTLTKSFASGGLSFDEDSAQRVMDLTDKILNSSGAVAAAKIIPKIKLPAPERDVPYDFTKFKTGEKTPGAKEAVSSAIANSGAQPVKPTAPQIKPNQPFEMPELAPLVPAQIVEQPSKRVFTQAPASLQEKIQQEIKSPPGAEESPMPLIRRRFEAENLKISQKVKVEDVKFVPKVMTPLDELKYLDLINFRRLDKDPKAATEKIKGKINLLAEENYGKRLDGIKFWRSSPVNKLYLEIGHLSISGNKPVDVIIEERKTAGGEYLTVAEFEAIMDLNKSLRF